MSWTTLWWIWKINVAFNGFNENLKKQLWMQTDMHANAIKAIYVQSELNKIIGLLSNQFQLNIQCKFLAF